MSSSSVSAWGFGQLLEQVASLEVSIGVDNRVQIGLTPCTILLDLLNFALVSPFEDTVARNVISLLAHILTYPAENLLVVHAGGLQQPNEVVNREVAVWTSVCLTNAGVVIAQDLLAGVRWVPTAAAVHIAANVTVGVADVVFVLGVELVIRLALE